MSLTPIDIQNKTFTKQMRGFSTQEVDDFLDQILKDYTEVLRKNRDYEKSIKHLEEKLRYFNELKEALNQSIIVAQETADQVKDSAQKEADVILADANNEAAELLSRTNREVEEMLADAKEKSERMVKEATDKANYLINDATAKANSLAAETDDLKKKTRSFHQRLTLLLESQLEITKSEEWDELLQPFTAYVTDEHQNFKNAVNMDKLESNEANKTEVSQGTKEEQAKVEVANTTIKVEQENENGEFLGETIALDREQLNEALTKQAKSEEASTLNSESSEETKVEKTTVVELPKLERRHKRK